MNARELAENAVGYFMRQSNSTECIAYIESLLSEALAEAGKEAVKEFCKEKWIISAYQKEARAAAYEEGLNQNAFYVAEKKKWMDQGIKVGEKIAYEDAAKIADEQADNSGPISAIAYRFIADKIRLRAGEKK